MADRKRMARGADSLLALRRERGLKPSLPVIVSLFGKVEGGRMNNPVVYADGTEEEWGWCRGLEVHVWTAPVAREFTGKVVLSIYRAAPSALSLWDATSHKGTTVYANEPAAVMMLDDSLFASKAERMKRYAEECAKVMPKQLIQLRWTRQECIEYANHTR